MTALASAFAAAALLVLAAAGSSEEEAPGCPAEVDHLLENAPQKADCLLQHGSHRKLPMSGFVSLIEEEPAKRTDAEGEASKDWQSHINEPASYEDAKPRPAHGPPQPSADTKHGEEDASGQASDLASVFSSALAALGEHPPNLVLLESKHAKDAKTGASANVDAKEPQSSAMDGLMETEPSGLSVSLAALGEQPLLLSLVAGQHVEERRRQQEQQRQQRQQQEAQQQATLEVTLYLPVPIQALEHPPLGPMDFFGDQLIERLGQAFSIKEKQMKILSVKELETKTSLLDNSTDDMPAAVTNQSYDVHAVPDMSPTQLPGEVADHGSAVGHDDELADAGEAAPEAEPAAEPEDEPKPEGKELARDPPKRVGEPSTRPLEAMQHTAVVLQFDLAAIGEEEKKPFEDIVLGLKKLLSDEHSVLHMGSFAAAFSGAKMEVMEPLPERGGATARVVLPSLLVLLALAAALSNSVVEP